MTSKVWLPCMNFTGSRHEAASYRQRNHTRAISVTMNTERQPFDERLIVEEELGQGV